MSSDARSGATPTVVPGGDYDLPRNEGVETRTKTYPTPSGHGGGGKFVLNDAHRPVEHIPFDAGETREIPDGSLYQHARAAYYAHEDAIITDPEGNERIVLSREFVIDGVPHGVIFTSSRWRGGRGKGDRYRPFYKYDVTVKPLDNDGNIEWNRTPLNALSLKIQPQYEGLVDSSGNPVNLPYGIGTLVHVQTTWVEHPEVLADRAAELVAHVFDYDLETSSINEESKGFWKAETHVRYDDAKTDDVVHTVRQSADLLAEHAADVDTGGLASGGQWLEAKITTRDWHELGFPRLNANILLKVYYPDNPQAVEYPFDQPKMEAALMGNPNGDNYHWNEWDDIMRALREIVLSHLVWADVGVTELVGDDVFDGPTGDPYEWQHPEGRRWWLRRHYESLVPDLYREVTKPNTQLVYDIIQCVRRHGTVNYQTLMDETGGAYRTVREHVTRLCYPNGDRESDEPGILKKIQGVQTWVAFSSRFFEDCADDALDQVYPDDTPEDERERAEERREERQQRQQENDADEQEDGGDGRDDRDDRGDAWTLIDTLNYQPSNVGKFIERGDIDPQDVKVRTSPYDWLQATG
ncbi:hypothetical protein [Halomontanus rarus]|uniref:DUF7845 domain-containing protein n=1 Tax=Halomontanus rarus TaxID=3034020 RepID=UPI0023E764AB|nr:hypothetical protein [Halovivax sp. TS33]